MNVDEIKDELVLMEADSNLITMPAYRANAEVWPNNSIPFVDNHLEYLKQHPAVNPRHYLSNLKLMIRRR